MILSTKPSFQSFLLETLFFGHFCISEIISNARTFLHKWLPPLLYFMIDFAFYRSLCLWREGVLPGGRGLHGGCLHRGGRPPQNTANRWSVRILQESILVMVIVLLCSTDKHWAYGTGWKYISLYKLQKYQLEVPSDGSTISSRGVVDP